MIKLNFKIDKDYLVYHTLINTDEDRFSSKNYKEDIISFQNYAWNLDKEIYNFLLRRSSGCFLDIKFLTSFDLNKKFKKFFSKIKKSKVFQIIYKQTQKYLTKSKKEWAENIERTTDIMSELTGIYFKKENKTFDVYITHPSLKNGMNYAHLNLNIIEFGHYEDFPNYFTIYMWHEILHFYLGSSDLEHAIIELIVDNELRIKLNKGKYPPFEGHKELDSLKQKILPYWRKYLENKAKNIYEFINKIKGPSILNHYCL